MVEKLMETKIDNVDPKRKGKNMLLFILLFYSAFYICFFILLSCCLKNHHLDGSAVSLYVWPWKCQILGDFFAICDGVITFSNVDIRNCLKLMMVMFFLFHLLTLVSLVNLLNLPSFWFHPRRMLPFLSVFFFGQLLLFTQRWHLRIKKEERFYWLPYLQTTSVNMCFLLTSVNKFNDFQKTYNVALITY